LFSKSRRCFYDSMDVTARAKGAAGGIAVFSVIYFCGTIATLDDPLMNTAGIVTVAVHKTRAALLVPELVCTILNMIGVVIVAILFCMWFTGSGAHPRFLIAVLSYSTLYFILQVWFLKVFRNCYNYLRMIE
ncbi:hypothetical protein PMAYCL1PPCAC_11205, partial [Pristionchus mayeri]